MIRCSICDRPSKGDVCRKCYSYIARSRSQVIKNRDEAEELEKREHYEMNNLDTSIADSFNNGDNDD